MVFCKHKKYPFPRGDFHEAFIVGGVVWQDA